jgi:hypothetical protein
MRRFLASNSLVILSLIAIKIDFGVAIRQRESREGQGARVYQFIIFSRGPWLALAGLELQITIFTSFYVILFNEFKGGLFTTTNVHICWAAYD